MSKNLTTESFNKLLKALSSDSAKAGEAYTKLRNSLVRFFEIKGDFEPETGADETLDRVAVKFSQNPEIDDLTKYSFGVARFVFLERIKIAQKEKNAAEGFYVDKISINSVAQTDDFLPLRECFARLNDAEKSVLEIFCQWFSFTIYRTKRAISGGKKYYSQ